MAYAYHLKGPFMAFMADCWVNEPDSYSLCRFPCVWSDETLHQQGETKTEVWRLVVSCEVITLDMNMLLKSSTGPESESHIDSLLRELSVSSWTKTRDILDGFDVLKKVDLSNLKAQTGSHELQWILLILVCYVWFTCKSCHPNHISGVVWYQPCGKQRIIRTAQSITDSFLPWSTSSPPTACRISQVSVYQSVFVPAPNYSHKL